MQCTNILTFLSSNEAPPPPITTNSPLRERERLQRFWRGSWGEQINQSPTIGYRMATNSGLQKSLYPLEWLLHNAWYNSGMHVCFWLFFCLFISLSDIYLYACISVCLHIWLPAASCLITFLLVCLSACCISICMLAYLFAYFFLYNYMSFSSACQPAVYLSICIYLIACCFLYV